MQFHPRRCVHFPVRRFAVRPSTNSRPALPQPALDTATHGRWTGKYYSCVGIFITSILGVKPKGSDYWAIWVNGHFSSKGVCDIKLRSGERLLFQIKK